MHTAIAFNLILKYILIFIISYMYLNSVHLSMDYLFPTIFFIILISITFDIFALEEFVVLLQQDLVDDE